MKERLENKIEAIVNFIISKPEEKKRKKITTSYRLNCAIFGFVNSKQIAENEWPNLWLSLILVSLLAGM